MATFSPIMYKLNQQKSTFLSCLVFSPYLHFTNFNKSIYIYMYIYMCVYIYVCIYICVYIYMCVYIYIYIYGAEQCDEIKSISLPS